FIASANAIVYEGGTPVFADVDPTTLNLDPTAVEAAITPRTKAILPVDLFGYPIEFDSFRQLADRHGLAIVEDACEALGATYRGRQVGSFGHPAVFAFYPNKQVTTGEGGAIALQTEDEWTVVKSLANQGRSDQGDTFAHNRIGYNYRLDELSAALCVQQLRKLDRILALRDEASARASTIRKRFGRGVARAQGRGRRGREVRRVPAGRSCSRHRRGWIDRHRAVRAAGAAGRRSTRSRRSGGGLAGGGRTIPSARLRPRVCARTRRYPEPLAFRRGFRDLPAGRRLPRRGLQACVPAGSRSQRSRRDERHRHAERRRCRWRCRRAAVRPLLDRQGSSGGKHPRPDQE